jgi:hypothetical protein
MTRRLDALKFTNNKKMTYFYVETIKTKEARERNVHALILASFELQVWTPQLGTL